MSLANEKIMNDGQSAIIDQKGTHSKTYKQF